MATLQEQADEFFNMDEFQNAFPLYLQIWEREKNEYNGKQLLKCYRKAGKFTEAYNFYDTLFTLYPNSGGVKLGKLWLDYSCKIKDFKNDNLIADAEELLTKTDKYNDFTGDIYNKTVLSVVKRLIYNEENNSAQTWLEKLDFSVLKTSPFSIHGQKYPSDQKEFFIRYADVLIKLDRHIDYIESCLTSLNFDGIKHTQFKKKIIEEITYGEYVSRVVLALYLKYFKVEIHNRKKNSFPSIYNPNKITTISDLGDFEFCPASFAINETFEITSNASWEKDEWLGEKKHLIDRYNEYQKSKNINEAFKDSSIEINDTTKNDFTSIFTSKLIINNYDGSNKTFYSNPTDTLRGCPDYVFENDNAKKFVIIEKFTKRTPENIQTAFSNDLIKLYGYIYELNTLNLDFGFLIYWYWQYEDIHTGNRSVKKKIRIKAYRIFKVEKIIENQNKLASIIDRIETFKQSKQITIDGDKISYANKCLHCSVVSYCNHKTGKFNLIKLPYDINTAVSSLPKGGLGTPQ